MLSASKPRIACVFEHPTLSGGERSMLEVARRLQHRFDFVAFAPPGGALRTALQSAGLEVVVFERTRRPASGETPAELTARALAGVVEADLLHGNSLSTAQFTGRAGELLGIPAIAHVREIEGLNPARVRRIEMNHTVIAVSHAVRDHLAGEGVAAEKISVVRNGVDLEALHPDRIEGTIRSELGLPSGCPLIATVGQISLRKATDVFVQTVGRLSRRRHDLRAIVVGERFSRKAETVRFEADLRASVERQRLAGSVRFLGWRDDVPSILRDLDLLVHPARQEPLGRVLLEAAALEVPCVAAEVGGNPEIIDHERTGWLVPPDDPEALAERIAWAIDHPDVRRRAGREARRKVEREFSGEACARRMEEIYCGLLKG